MLCLPSRPTPIRCWGIFGPALLAFAGCGGPGGEFPTSPVTVTVMYNGIPLDGATVTFLTEDVGKPVSAVGRTDDSGVTKMKTYGQADGAVRGKHRVTILKSDAAESQADVADVESDEYDPSIASRPAERPKSLIPPKYGTPNSGLSVTVGDAPVEVTFELED